MGEGEGVWGAARHLRYVPVASLLAGVKFKAVEEEEEKEESSRAIEARPLATCSCHHYSVFKTTEPCIMLQVDVSR